MNAESCLEAARAPQELTLVKIENEFCGFSCKFVDRFSASKYGIHEITQTEHEEVQSRRSMLCLRCVSPESPHKCGV